MWHFCKQSDRRKLERVQERALRVVCNSKTESSEELLNRASLPSLYDRRLQDIAIVMFKVKNGIAPNYISDLFNSSSKGYSLRSADFNLPRFSTVRYGKHSLRYFGPWLWSRLNATDRNRKTLDNFKSSIRRKDLASLVEDVCSNCNLCCS